MTEQLISFETAKLAKEKGFTLSVVGSGIYNYFNDDGNISWSHLNLNQPAKVPQSLLQKWLREEHGWHIITIPVVTMCYTFKIIKAWKKDFNPDLIIEEPPYKGVDGYDYSTHEAALEQGLVEVLKLINK